ncbi:MAG: HAD-IA family hydrolase [Candidatus Eremiobacteraeota bacterium]|nr:HAD-IA family hydrolase [Candidatus Eremiobacteraeota bacterium]
MQSDTIQAVFFDAGYTLLCMDPDQVTIFLGVCDQLSIGIDRERLAGGIAKANSLLAPRAARLQPQPFSQTAVDEFWTRYNHTLLSLAALDPRDARHAELVYRRFTAAITWRIYDEVRPVLSTLRRRGIALGIISNWTGDLEDVLHKLELHGAFDFVLDSSRLGYEKPHAQIFLEAVRRAGITPATALHVGDSPEHDVDGALASGLRAILLDRANRYPAFDRAPRVTDLNGLLQHLS